MRFLVDAQLPHALARMLTQHGHVAEHVHDIGLGDAPDRDVWRYAIDHEAVLITVTVDSVVNVTQIATVDRLVLEEHLGTLSDWLIDQIDAGILRALALNSR